MASSASGRFCGDSRATRTEHQRVLRQAQLLARQPPPLGDTVNSSVSTPFGITARRVPGASMSRYRSMKCCKADGETAYTPFTHAWPWPAAAAARR